MTLSRRTFMMATAALGGTLALPSLAFASFCRSSPATMEKLFGTLDRVAPDMAYTEARRQYELASLGFDRIYAVAISGGMEGERAYVDQSASERAVFIQEVFAESGRAHDALKGLRNAFAAAGVGGVGADILDLQVNSFEGDYDTRRTHVVDAVKLLADSRSDDAIVLSAKADLIQAISTVGNGDAARAVELAWQASPHTDRNHFKQFLPMVSASDMLVYRLGQLKNGAAVLA